MTEHSFKTFEYDKPDEIELVEKVHSFYDLLKVRRSIREFSTEKIPAGLSERLIQTAATAPSGANKQPWFFGIVRSQDIKREIRIKSEEVEKVNYGKKFSEDMKEDLVFLETNCNKPFLEEAPELIIVFKEKYHKTDAGKTKPNYYVNESVGIAVGILITAIHQAGLVTVPYTPAPNTFLNELLYRPENERAVMILPIGFPKKDTKIPEKERKSFERIVNIY